MTDGPTQVVGLIGWPIEHTLSPTIHNAAFRSLGLDWVYVPLPVRPGQARSAVRGLVSLGFRGANVTVPHKEAVLQLVDVVDEQAKVIGAVNTLDIRPDPDGGSTVFGRNTDAPGFVRVLDSVGFEPKGSRALVLGAGGAARSAVYALLCGGAQRVVVVNRTAARAKRLVGDLASRCGCSEKRHGSPPDLQALPLTRAALRDSVRDVDLIVNATPAGMWPDVASSPWPVDLPFPTDRLVFDLVYNPVETVLMQQARASGAQVVGGLEMLIQQGAMALTHWVEGEVSVNAVAKVMRKAAREALGEP